MKRTASLIVTAVFALSSMAALAATSNEKTEASPVAAAAKTTHKKTTMKKGKASKARAAKTGDSAAPEAK